MRKKAIDSGMALVLICLILHTAFQVNFGVYLALVLLVINMVCPTIYTPFSKIWFKFSETLGTIVSKIVLCIVFFGVIFHNLSMLIYINIF